MSHQLINHNEDLRKLQDEGYNIDLIDSYLVIHDIPYVNENRLVVYGTIASSLSLSGNSTNKPDTHAALWVGSYPCDYKGAKLINLVAGSDHTRIRDGLVSSFSFSQKPSEGYADYYQKMTRYIQILQNEARVLEPTATAMTGASGTSAKEDPIFCYSDTASSRAGITSINERLRKHRIAIVGLGGTGSYVLDFVAKTPVEEIHLFDDDEFQNHNAFRSPGAPSSDDFSPCMVKVDWFAKIYSKMRKKIIPHAQRIDESNLSELNPMTIVFLCVDSGKSREVIINYLIENKIPLIDTGVGLRNENDALDGAVRTTTCTPSFHNHAESRIPHDDAEDNEYSNNIQIAEMNALNAAFAVIKWKKMCKFYNDYDHEHNTVYGISKNLVTNDEISNEA